MTVCDLAHNHSASCIASDMSGLSSQNNMQKEPKLVGHQPRPKQSDIYNHKYVVELLFYMKRNKELIKVPRTGCVISHITTHDFGKYNAVGIAALQTWQWEG